jgi:hypothetical protein
MSRRIVLLSFIIIQETNYLLVGGVDFMCKVLPELTLADCDLKNLPYG